MSELKPCPFCEGNAECYVDAGCWYVRCTNCGVETRTCDSKDEALGAWNCRMEVQP